MILAFVAGLLFLPALIVVFCLLEWVGERIGVPHEKLQDGFATALALTGAVVGVWLLGDWWFS